MALVLAQTWHFWIAPVLVASAVLLILTLIGLYLKVVVSQRYPKR